MKYSLFYLKKKKMKEISLCVLVNYLIVYYLYEEMKKQLEQ